MSICIIDIIDEADSDCNLTEPLGSEGDHELNVDSNDDDGDCNQRRLIVGRWPDLMEDVHDPDFDSYVKDFHDMVSQHALSNYDLDQLIIA